jgi:hypothetical protein
MRIRDLNLLDSKILAVTLYIFENQGIISADNYLDITDEFGMPHDEWCPHCQ